VFDGFFGDACCGQILNYDNLKMSLKKRLEIEINNFHVLVQFQSSKAIISNRKITFSHILISFARKLSNFSRAKNRLGHVTVVNILQVLPLAG